MRASSLKRNGDLTSANRQVPETSAQVVGPTPPASGEGVSRVGVGEESSRRGDQYRARTVARHWDRCVRPWRRRALGQAFCFWAPAACLQAHLRVASTRGPGRASPTRTWSSHPIHRDSEDHVVDEMHRIARNGTGNPPALEERIEVPVTNRWARSTPHRDTLARPTDRGHDQEEERSQTNLVLVRSTS